MQKKNKTGFSLIELLVVVAIIGVLAAIGIVGYQKYLDSAKDAVTKANLKLLANALSAEDTTLTKCSDLAYSSSSNLTGYEGNAWLCANKITQEASFKSSNGAPITISSDLNSFRDGNGSIVIGNSGQLLLNACNDMPSVNYVTNFNNGNGPYPFVLVGFLVDGSQTSITLDLKSNIKALCQF